jgi:hypothetical protein
LRWVIANATTAHAGPSFQGIPFCAVSLPLFLNGAARAKSRFNLEGHKTTNEGPRVKVQVAVPDPKGKGGSETVQKAFIEGWENYEPDHR